MREIKEKSAEREQYKLMWFELEKKISEQKKAQEEQPPQ